MLLFFFLLFVLMPIIEIAVLLNVGAAIGWLPTIGIVILTAVVGTWMLRQQGLATLLTARQRMQSGEMPAQQLVEGMILVVGGALLLTPGFVTDTVGFACLLPPTRAFMARYIGKRAQLGISIGAAGMGPGHGVNPGSAESLNRGGPGAGTRSTGPSRPDHRTRHGDVIDGEFRRED